MRIHTAISNTFPNKREWWQVVILPTISILRNRLSYDEAYTCIVAEWLFWSIEILIDDDGQKD
jgi:hypothetical protein